MDTESRERKKRVRLHSSFGDSHFLCVCTMHNSFKMGRTHWDAIVKNVENDSPSVSPRGNLGQARVNEISLSCRNGTFFGKATLNFLVRGHTKNACDRMFTLMKKVSTERIFTHTYNYWRHWVRMIK